MLEWSTRVESPGVESCRFSPSGDEFPKPSQLAHMDTLTGKLKSICPTLYYSLTSWERNELDSCSSLGLQGENELVSTPCRDPTYFITEAPHSSARDGGSPRIVVSVDTRGVSDHHLDSEEDDIFIGHNK
jgi:hypothetical protein